MKLIFKDRDLCILFFATLLFFSNEAVFLPTLPVHLSKAGYSNFQIGIVLAAFALGVLVFRPLSGYITDKISRKISLTLGVFIFFITPLFYLFSTNIIYLIILRFFHGLGITFYTTAMPAYVTDIVSGNKNGEALGHLATATTMAFAFGPFIGIWAFSNFNFAGPVFVCTLIGFFNLILILLIRERKEPARADLKISFKQVVLKRSILVSSMAILMNAVIFGGIMTFLPLLVNQTPGLNIGFFFLTQAIVVIVCRLFMAHFSDLYGRGPVFFYSSIIILVAVFVVSRISSFEILIFAAVLFGIGTSLCTPSLSAYIADKTQPEQRGTAFSFYYGAFDAGVLIAGVVLGFIADLTSLKTMFVIAGIAGGVVLIIFSLCIQKKVTHSIAWTLFGRQAGR
ncbi:MAG: MFS transporter [Desulfobacteraceae bacterium]|nr:MFS transporter [Desulfobacteraceae bacterium]